VPAYQRDPDKDSWIEIELVDREGQPMAGEPYRILLPDGSAVRGVLDQNGEARVEGIDPGDCEVTFPQRDGRSWRPRG